MFKKTFTTKNIAVIGLLTAMSFILYLLPKWIPIFNLPFFPSWLDIQISDLPAMLGGFAINPLAAIIIVVLKCAFKLPLTSSSGVGELADVLIGIAFVLPASIIYKYHKTKWFAVIGLLVGSFSATLVGVVANRFILIPFYAWFYGKGDTEQGMELIVVAVSTIYKGVTVETFYKYYLLLAVVPFNLLRCIISSLITFFVYKPLSKFLHWERKTQKSDDVEFSDVAEIKELCSDSEEQTKEIAKEYAKTLKRGDVVLLSGELGAGKTAFVKGVAEYFGLDGVVSPTYAYLNVYGDFLYHYDCYRLSSAEDAERLGLIDYFGGDNICLIEWSENIKDAIPEKAKKVVIEKTSENGRKITL